MDSRAIRTGIVSSVIAAVLTAIFINPILSFVWKITVGVAGATHHSYVDAIYSRAARLEGVNQATVLMFSILLMLLLGVASFLFFLSRTGDIPPRTARVYLQQSFFCLGLNLVLFIPASLYVGVSRINSSFEQRLTVLAPAIPDSEYKTLKARWASMHSKADYDALTAAMEKRAAELGVTLPPVRNP
jgi:hypothetical protein